jgi:hypothetical protein
VSVNALIVDAETPFTEAEAADRLGISKASLMRERIAGRIHPYRIGQRIIRYTDAILSEYLESCRNVPEKSATTGSPNGQAPRNGAARGTTPTLGRHDAHHLAQTIFKRPK